MGDICRICLVNNIEGIDIFGNYKTEYNLREIIYELTLVEVSAMFNKYTTTRRPVFFFVFFLFEFTRKGMETISVCSCKEKHRLES